jgi:hypothetical protein
METGEAHEGRRDGPGLYQLIAAIVIGGTAWALSLEVGYALVKPACRADRIVWLTVVNGLALIGCVAGLWLGRLGPMRLRWDASDAGGRPTDRSFFMALVAIGLNSLFALLILLSTVPQLLRLPCE